MVAPGWLDEIEPATAPPWVRMGTRALGDGPWLLGGDDVEDQLAEKHRVLAHHHDEVVAALDGTEEAGVELLARIGDSAGNAEDVGDLHPIDAAARLVAEDLCLLTGGEDSSGWILAAGSVCFPSHWRLPDKIGRPMAAVHEPVPDYATDLSARVDRFLDKLRPGRGVWRRNWTVHSAPDLFAPDLPPPPDPPITTEDAGHRLWLRSERQTLTRLPRTNAIVFTIRTQQVPLQTVARRPALRAQLARAVEGWPPHQITYRGGPPLQRPLLAWLQDHR